MDSTTSPGPVDASTAELDGDDIEPVAIIGFAFKFPGEGDTPDGFWKMLLEKQCVMTEFPKDRMSVDSHYRKEKKQTTVSKLRAPRRRFF
jgi:acyl transferase domain-containing protein